MAQPLDKATHPPSTDNASKRLMTASFGKARARLPPWSCFAARPPSYRRRPMKSFRQNLTAGADLPLVGSDSNRQWLLPCLLSPQRQYQRALAASVTVLAQIDSLPCAKEQPAAADRP